jgi:hypothetical protein
MDNAEKIKLVEVSRFYLCRHAEAYGLLGPKRKATAADDDMLPWLAGRQKITS